MKKVKVSQLQKREDRQGYFFIMPYVILFIVFTGIPFVMAMGMSFVNIQYITKLENLRFVGFNNFVKIFKSKETMQALMRTFQYSLVYVPLLMVTGFSFAVILNKGVYFKKGIRAMVFLPYVSNMVAIAIVFKLLLGPNGPVVQSFKALGIEFPVLLQDLKLALPTVAAIAVWKSIGLNMVIYLGALQNVPAELIEAAEIDGASRWQRIRHVVLPVISPTTFFLLISSLINSLQNFTVIQSLTEGGPGQATTVMSITIVRTAFMKYQTSLASAQALLMFAIIMIITLIQWRGQKKWVNY